MTSPHKYNLPHDSFRPHQERSILWNLALKGIGITEKPTGSGKTADVTAITSRHRVVSLVKTKALQAENYGDLYDWDVLFGRGNYPCIHPDNFPNATADDCLFGSMMGKCGKKSKCPYVIRKKLARASPKGSLNYSYWLVAGKRWPPPDYLVLDEAHMASDVVLDFVGIKLHEGHRKTWGLPRFPRVGEPKPFSTERASVANRVMDWLKAAGTVLDERAAVMAKELKGYRNLKLSKKLAQCERLLSKMDTTVDALENSPRDWFIRAGQRVIYRQGRNSPGILARPLTARHDFTRLFHAEKMLLMSATIGDIASYVEELGLKDYEYLQVPNQFPPEARPIHILDAPRLGRKSTDLDYQKQAEVIAAAIESCPSDWSGIIHVTSKKEAGLLAARLANNGLDKRIWPMTGYDGEPTPTNKQVEDWKCVKQKKQGAICVSWSMWEGYDGLDERICIVAKCFTPDVGIVGPDGLKGIDNVKVGDEVFGITSSGELIVDHVQRIVSFLYDGPVYDLKATHCDITVTPDHDMLAGFPRRADGFGHFTKHAMHKLEGAEFQVPTWAGSWKGNALPGGIEMCKFWPKNSRIGLNHIQERQQSNILPKMYSTIDFLKLCGWFVSEGHTFHNRKRKYKNTTAGEVWGISLTQNEGQLLIAMEETLTRLKLPYRKDHKGGKGYRLSLNSRTFHDAFIHWFGKGAHNKKLPSWLLQLETPGLQVVFDAMMQGDGHFSATGQPIYTTSSRTLSSNVVELGLKLGMRPNIRKARRGSIDIGFSKKRKKGTIRPRNVEKHHYYGRVWCVTTDTGTVYAGRNGRYIFIGQCPFPFLGDEYERARLAYSHRFYNWRTGCKLSQSLGRTRRGRKQDYDLGERTGLVAIADGNWSRVRKYLSQDVREAICGV